MTTVAELIEHLQTLPPTARVEVVYASTTRGHWEQYTNVYDVDLRIPEHIQFFGEREGFGSNPYVMIGVNE